MNMVLIAGLLSFCLVEVSWASQSQKHDRILLQEKVEQEVHTYIDKNFLAAGHSGLLIESKKIDTASGYAADLTMQMSAQDNTCGDYVCINVRVTQDDGTLKGEFILYDKNSDVDTFRWGMRYDTFVLLGNYTKLCPEKRNEAMRECVKNYSSTFIEELFSIYEEDTVNS